MLSASAAPSARKRFVDKAGGQLNSVSLSNSHLVHFLRHHRNYRKSSHLLKALVFSAES